MMIEKYRVSLEVAKELKEAGFPQDGCDGYWYLHWTSGESAKWLLLPYDEDDKINSKHAAPCVGRLGVELPYKILLVDRFDEQYYYLNESFTEWGTTTGTIKEFTIVYRFNNSIAGHLKSQSESEADVRALMWIELKKRGLL